MSLRRITLVFAALAAVAAVGASSAAANHHRLRITEVFGGVPGRENAQFVELQMFTAGQEVVHDASLNFFDPAGGALGSDVFPSDVANDADNAHVLAATPQAASFFGITPDMTMTDLINRPAGRLDYKGRPGSATPGLLDAFSWGGTGFTGDSTGTGTPFAPLQLGISAHRDLSGGSVPGELDTGDDTADSAADFVSGQPSPTNNAGATTDRATIVSRPGGGMIKVDAAEGVTNLIGIQGNPTAGWRIVDTAAPVHIDPSAAATCMTS